MLQDEDEEEKEVTVDGRRISPALRKKATGLLRTWLVIDGWGQSQLLEAGKHAIMRRTGLPARDLRILDPMLSYPSTILGRERAIVINLEHIKAILTAQEVLLLNSKDPAVAPFAADLQCRLRHLPDMYCVPAQREIETSDTDMEVANKTSSDSPLSAMDSELASPSDHEGFLEIRGFPEGTFTEVSDQKVDGLKLQLTDSGNGTGPKILPFEFKALEACLEATCNCLESETTTLEQEAYPALDELTSKISTLNLERVKQIKSRLVAISGRVQKVRDELEHLLDDDEDMAEMYLTDKLIHQQLDETSSLPSVDGTKDGVSYDIVKPKAKKESDKSPIGAMDLLIQDEDGNSCSSDSSSSNNSGSKHLDVDELEMLLEAYFVQIDGTLNKLSTLREYVDDTEDYINIMLDDKQNHLLQMGVMLSTATLCLGVAIVIAGIFGMNIHLELFEPEHAGLNQFMWTVGGLAAGCLFLYTVAIAWAKKRRLLE